MKHDLFMILLISMFILSIACVSASDVGDELELNDHENVIDNIDDNVINSNENTVYISPDGSGDGLSSDNPTKWDDAYEKANDGWTIVFNDGEYKDIVNKTIDKELTLKAQNKDAVILDAQNKNHFFTITKNKIVLDGIIFKNGNATAGGALFFTNGSLNSNFNCKFIDCQADKYGGAIFFNNSVNYTEFESDFINCSAAYGGGALYCQGGGSDNIFGGNFLDCYSNYGGAITLQTYSEVYNNRNKFIGNFINCTASSGGALATYDIAKDCIFSGRFINCTSANVGGAFYLYNSINNKFTGEFMDCYSDYGGLAYFSYHSINDTFDSEFINCSAEIDGGVAYVSNAMNITFLGDYINCSAMFGGIAHVQNSFYNSTANVNVKNSVGRYGMAFSLYNAKHSVVKGTFIDCISNTNYGDGTVYCNGPISNFTVNGTFINCFADYGAGVALFSTSDNLTNHIYGTFINCSSHNLGAVCLYTSNTYVRGTFINCTSEWGGGAVFSYWDDCNNTISGEFIDCYSEKGGAIDGNHITIENATFINNRATNGSAIFIRYYDENHRMAVGGDVNITNCVFINNKGYSTLLNLTNITKNNDCEISIVFKGSNTMLNAIYGYANLTNVTYWGYNGLINSDSSENTKGFYAMGQNITWQLLDSKNNVVQSGVGVTDNNGLLKLNFNNLGGNYTFKAIHYDDDYYTEISRNITLEFEKMTPYLSSDYLQIAVGDDAVFNVKMQSDINGKLIVTVNNTNLTFDIINGESTVIIPSNLFENTYLLDALATFEGNEKYKSGQSSLKGSVIQAHLFGPNNLTRGWNSGMDAFVYIADASFNPLFNKEVSLTVNGQTYKAISGSGAIIYDIKLPVGTYNATFYYNDRTEVLNTELTIVKRLLENKNIVMDYADGTQYKVLAIGDDGQPVGAGETVIIKVNGVTYKVKTDSNGYATLKINLKPKTYTITAEYKNTKVSNKLTVKQILKSSNVKVKKSAKKLVLKATLKSSKGKAISGKKITFKFKGKTYKAKTNKKGIAKVTIKKNVIKKLKKGKKYAVKITYLKDTIKKTVKVK